VKLGLRSLLMLWMLWMACGLVVPVMAQHEATARTSLSIPSELAATPPAADAVSETSEPALSTTLSAVWDVDRDASGESMLGVIRGRVINGSLSGEVPDELTVNLFGINGQQVVVRETVGISSGGEFIFEDVLIVEGWLFFVAAEYQGVLYYTASAEIPLGDRILELPLEIFDSTDSDDFIRVEQLHILFDFSAPEAVGVLEVWVISNTGDRTYVSREGGIEVVLPQEASGLQFGEGELGERFLPTELGFIDTAAVTPGIGTLELFFTYEIPHAGRLDFSQPLGYAVLGVEVMLPEGDPAIIAGELQDSGVRQVSTGPLQTYTTGPLEPGETLSFSITENVSEAGGVWGSEALTGLLIGGGILGVALIVVGYAWRRVSLRRARDKAIRHPDEILQAIAELDDELALGQIAEGEYQKQREELKQQALEWMSAEDD
jgi:hypothetical protein